MSDWKIENDRVTMLEPLPASYEVVPMGLCAQLHRERDSLRAENERLIGVVDIEVERKAALMAENESLKKKLSLDMVIVAEENSRLRTQLAKAKECLEFYATAHQIKFDGGRSYSPIQMDHGKRARKTLGELKPNAESGEE